MKYFNHFFICLLFLNLLTGQAVPHTPPIQPIPEGLQFSEINPGTLQVTLDLTVNTQPEENHFCSQTGLELISDDLVMLTLWAVHLQSHDKIYIRYFDSRGYLGPFSSANFNFDGSLMISGVQPGKMVIEYYSSITDPVIELYLTAVESMPPRQSKPVKQPIPQTAQDREHKVVMVTGFWPPTNEMIRQFSQDTLLNPWGWQGDNWQGRGYDVLSFFPEFEEPDCSDCGMGYGNLEVDYQDTSGDFWLLVEQVRPMAIITFSRGWMDNSWEMEYNFYNRTNWVSDYLAPVLPTPNPPDSDEANFFLRNSTLPMETIRDAVAQEVPVLNPYIDWAGDPGHFVSEFMGYHGVWYRDLYQFSEESCIIAGHVHVGGLINWGTARNAAEVTIRTVIEYLDQLDYSLGDINDDALVNIQDILLIVQIIIGQLEPSLTQDLAADLNQDDIINVLDVIIMVNMILG